MITRSRFVFPALGLCIALGGSACSKGGTMGPGGGGGGCRRLSDPDPDQADGGLPQLPSSLYAELRNAESGTVIPIELNGLSGSYSGMSRAFQKCEAPGNYFVERAVLVDARGGAVAVATRLGSSYQVVYQQGTTTAVSASGFSRYYTSFSMTSGTAVPTLQSVTGSATSVKQGEMVTVSSAAMAASDDCGMREMQWWLSPYASVGSMSSPASVVVIKDGQSSGGLHVPADVAAGTYVLEGRLYSKSGRYALIRRMSTADSSYYLYNPNTGNYTATGISVVRIDVTTNASADRQAPQVLKIEATPASVGRCQQISMSLKLSDDHGLPLSQQVKVLLGPLGQGTLTSVMLTGSSDSLSGMFTVPLDAPPGVWLGYPESIVDAAGNLGTGSLSDGSFTIEGPGITTPVSVPAANFVVQGDTQTGDLGVPDLGVGTQDLRMDSRFPAILTNINVSPTSVTADQPVTVTITWTDNGAGLK